MQEETRLGVIGAVPPLQFYVVLLNASFSSDSEKKCSSADSFAERYSGALISWSDLSIIFDEGTVLKKTSRRRVEQWE